MNKGMDKEADSMNPGQYVGEDGRTYTWCKDRKGYCLWVNFDNCRESGGFPSIPAADWPKAKAALDALIESEQEGWMELEQFPYRIMRDGSRAEFRATDGVYRNAGHSLCLEAFRAGLKTGQEQEREKVRELVGAVGHADGWATRPSYSGYWQLCWKDWERIKALAKAVKV